MHTATCAAIEPSAALTLGPWSLRGLPAGSPAPVLSNQGDEAFGWLPAVVPGTVAGALDAAGLWDFDRPTDLDAQDWWFRTTFARPARPDDANDRPCRLLFDGLAGTAEVRLNGRLILTGENMFRTYCRDVSEWLEDENELLIGFRALAELLKQKRPRPRWKTNLVRNQALRWHRTSLVGRIPGWAPCAPTIGPWRDVRLESTSPAVDDVHIATAVAGTTGVVTVRVRLAAATETARAVFRVGDVETVLALDPTADGRTLAGELRIVDVPLWWPHTHGKPARLAASLTVKADGETVDVPIAPLGFRTIEVPDHGRFAITVNGVPVFCRGACWTVGDLLSPACDEATLRRDLQLARDAGANMLRVGGTMNYESETFYRLCDELGLLVWQDFMFANMDYPVDDPAFRDNIRSEAREQLARLAAHPSVAVYCGNSEIEQQAAMLGLPPERRTNDWFSRELPELCGELHPGTPYVPSTPTGGALPFHTHTGVSHYYGVGAYLRPTSDLRRADVKFTPECLGFANIPEPAAIYAVTGGAHPVLHDPAWKRRVPRDGGAGWDFEDVRDHYLKEVFGVAPAELRSFDMPRYLELSRAVTGEMMAAAFSEWRSTHSSNRGGLVWFYKDLWPGAGWGVVDSTGVPKAAYYYLRRSWRTRQLTLTDEGLNGFDLHLTNEADAPLDGKVEIVLLKEPNVVVARGEAAVRLEPRSSRRLGGDALLGRFTDSTYAYRFGPPSHDLAIATWFDAQSQVIGEAVHFVRRLAGGRAAPSSVRAAAEFVAEGVYRVALRSDRFLDTVRLQADGYLPDDNYFHLPPDRTKIVTFRARSAAAGPLRGTLEALNLAADLEFSLHWASL